MEAIFTQHTFFILLGGGGVISNKIFTIPTKSTFFENIGFLPTDLQALKLFLKRTSGCNSWTGLLGLGQEGQ